MKTCVFLALLGLTGIALGADFYEWVDEKGVKQFTQQPPPAHIKQVQQRRLGSNVIETSGPSYSMQQAIKNFPVTLYVTDCGDICQTARAHLSKRGIPHSEKNPQKQEEIEAFKKLTGGAMEVPLLVVGQLKTVKGYLASEWDAALDAAGYPSTAVPGGKPAANPPIPGKADTTPPATAK